MQLTDEDIRKFRQIWKEEFNEEITEGYARQRATAVLEMMVLTLKHQAKRSSPSSRSSGSKE